MGGVGGWRLVRLEPFALKRYHIQVQEYMWLADKPRPKRAAIARSFHYAGPHCMGQPPIGASVLKAAPAPSDRVTPLTADGAADPNHLQAKLLQAADVDIQTHRIACDVAGDQQLPAAPRP